MATTVLSDVWNSSTTTDSLAATGRPLLEPVLMYRIRLYIWYYGTPVILLFGNFGNVMTILIMRRMASGESVVNIYFTGLAIVDLVILDLFLLTDWIGITYVFWFKNTSNAVCKLLNWISTGSTTISAWFLVSLTVHRAISVVWPHRVNLLCTRRKVVILLAGTATFFAVVYSHYLYGYELIYYERYGLYSCQMISGSYRSFIGLFSYIDLVLYSLLPFTCLIIANSVLVWKLRATVRETRHKFAQGSDQTEAREKTTKSVTLTVILVSAAFIVLTLPASIYHVMSYLAVSARSKWVEDQSYIYVIQALTYMMLFSNNAVNFYLYCLTGKRFREEFIKIISCGRFMTSPGALPASVDSSKRSARH
ncbi:putative G-protein coupled receptor 139 [Babylonia areolata]|uniref:putative G-protein coupled receptor 139 n=1 Tax=Babylonia areolata TaxID=304850 RepID=UPI003FD102E8